MFGRETGIYFLKSSPFLLLFFILYSDTGKKARRATVEATEQVGSKIKEATLLWVNVLLRLLCCDKRWLVCLCESDPPVLADLPRTCFSRPSMTWTACCRMISLVWALSVCRWAWHILPSSLKASLMSRTRTLSLALLARRRSRSLCSFSSAVRFSSVTETTLQPGGEAVGWIGWLTNPNHNPWWS